MSVDVDKLNPCSKKIDSINGSNLFNNRSDTKGASGTFGSPDVTKLRAGTPEVSTINGSALYNQRGKLKGPLSGGGKGQ